MTYQAPQSGTVWRLIYTEGYVIRLFETGGCTHTKYTCEEFQSKEEAETRISQLGLVYNPS